MYARAPFRGSVARGYCRDEQAQRAAHSRGVSILLLQPSICTCVKATGNSVRSSPGRTNSASLAEHSKNRSTTQLTSQGEPSRREEPGNRSMGARSSMLCCQECHCEMYRRFSHLTSKSRVRDSCCQPERKMGLSTGFAATRSGPSTDLAHCRDQPDMLQASRQNAMSSGRARCLSRNQNQQCSTMAMPIGLTLKPMALAR